MKHFLSLALVALIATQAWANDVTFDFTTRAGVQAMGLTAPGSDSYVSFNTPVTVDGVTVTPLTQAIRITNDDEGDQYLHMLSTAANGIQSFSIGVEDGYTITAVRFKYTTPAQVDKIAFDSGTFEDEYWQEGNRYAEYCNWTGETPLLTVSTIGAGQITGTQKTYVLLIDNFVVTYEQATATGVSDINTTQATPVAYYNLAGQQSTTPFSGVNIVRMSDGTAHKVIK